MFVFDGAKVRLIAIAMAAATALPLMPKADALKKPRATETQVEVVKAPKKTKRKGKSSTAEHVKTITPKTSPWKAYQAKSVAFEEPKRLSKAKVVIAYAKKQLGKPYRYGAVGPSSFDCSGFTMFVWKKAGIHLPHNSGAQRAATKHVPLDKMKPGDLVFSAGHVGLYIGEGKMIHSPQTGDHVKISPIHGNTYGAGRPAA